jgi:D-beta-D-heptose 7-phosphate kinase/D-beta-D-heptose 1-phosphate adenosyltransferase
MKTIFMTGTFDVLHRGHIEVLKYAKSLGDKLIVAVDTDARVKKLKGETRPIYSLDDRISMLLAVRYVDHVVSFETDDDLIELLKQANPDVLLAGSDWKDKPGIGRQYAKEVMYFNRIEPHSTTNTILKAINNE